MSYSGTENLEVMAEARNYNHFLVDCVNRFAPTGTNRYLDFGAGTGTFARMVTATGADVDCVELDDRLRNRLSNEFRAFRTPEDLPQAYDYIYTLNVLEHIDDDGAALHSLHQALKPGGRLLVYVPAFNVLFSEMDRKVGHFRRYRAEELIARIEGASLSTVEWTYVDSIGWLAALAYRLLPTASGQLGERSVRLYDRYVFPASRLLDRAVQRFCGKNLLLVAERPLQP